MPAAASPQTRSSRRLLAVICSAELLLVLDTTVVNVALVAIGRDLGMSARALAWVINSYGLTLAGLLLIGGRVADLLGRRRAFTGGVLLFGLACAAAAIAPNGTTLIAARLVQGAAAALVTPAALGLLTVGFPHGPQRMRALSAWATVSAVGGTTGVVVSGAVSELLSWRWVFALNAVVVAFVLGAGRRLLPADRPEPPASLNLAGTTLVTAGLFALVYCLEAARDISPVTWVLPFVLLSLFARSERRASSPLLPGHGARRGELSRAVALMAIVSASLGCAFFALTLNFQQIRGWSPARAGLMFVPFGTALLVGSWLGPMLQRRCGARVSTAAGLASAAAGMVGLAAVPERGPAWGLLLGLVLLPLGIGSLFVLLTNAGLERARDTDASVSGALLSVVQQVGTALGVAVVAATNGVADHWLLYLSAAAGLIAATALLPRSPDRTTLRERIAT